ncbi:sodium ion-translocating decarboxylase subunit beta [Thermoanaerobacter kivui]|uniref:sodium ion-translocating decarboxylase subunit beta n=1 Tax=Thermoanaerobacter kivui TaxID=2325 RepID=UPI0009FBF887|nr:sodium ion-translocating decarboxylase subunit beta [Thermoanaerobacter kivui]
MLDFNLKETAAIGIIGTADGPTSFYVTRVYSLDSREEVFRYSLVERQTVKCQGGN